jgi:hypothetical protein
MRLGSLLNVAMMLAICVGCNAPPKTRSAPDRRSEDKPGRAEQSAPKAGGHAPLFQLNELGGKDRVDLASFVGKQPVLLFFGSYT